MFLVIIGLALIGIALAVIEIIYALIPMGVAFFHFFGSLSQVPEWLSSSVIFTSIIFLFALAILSWTVRTVFRIFMIVLDNLFSKLMKTGGRFITVSIIYSIAGLAFALFGVESIYHFAEPFNDFYSNDNLFYKVVHGLFLLAIVFPGNNSDDE